MEIEELKKLILERLKLKRELESLMVPLKDVELSNLGLHSMGPIMSILPTVPKAFELVKAVDDKSDQLIGFIVEQIKDMEALLSE